MGHHAARRGRRAVARAQGVSILHIDIQAMVIPAVIVDADMMDKGVHFAVNSITVIDPRATGNLNDDRSRATPRP